MQAGSVVVITGSTKGIGLGLAQAFCQRGCRVMVSGRDPARLQAALEALARADPEGQVNGQICDVRDSAQVQALWDAALRRYQRVDYWISNAAMGSIEQDFWAHDAETIDAVIETNVLGTLYSCRVAAKGMLAQGHGYLFTLEGWGSNGETRSGSTLYGTSKAAIRYFTKSMAAELRRTPVRLCSINPGLVPTDLLALSIKPARSATIKRFINIFGDRVETVAPAIAERVLANPKHGDRIVWLTPLGMFRRLLRAPFVRRDIS